MTPTRKIYLNNAATSWPKAPGVADAVKSSLENQPGEVNRGGIDAFDIFGEVRKKIAKLIGINDKNRIALGPNATWALNLALFGFPLEKNDLVLSTCSEHNSVLRPLYRLEQEGIRVHYLEVDEFGRIPSGQWKEALQRYRPRLCVFTHASNVTGAVNDAAKLIGEAKDVGATLLLDASQSLGWLPVEALNWEVDMIAFTGHKYLLGPQGTGGLYVAPHIELKPWLVGGTGIHSNLETMPPDMPLRLEAGTGNEASFHGLLRALQWQEDYPLERGEQGEKLRYLKEGLCAAGAKIIDPPGECTPVVSFVIEGCSPTDAAFILGSSYDIICRTGLHCAPKIFPYLGYPDGSIRVSLSRFSTKDEIDALLDGVCAIKKSA